jgi:hypothetical protein
MQSDPNYFSRRANEERVAAMKAAHPGARQAHLKLASRYEKLANADNGGLEQVTLAHSESSSPTP